MLSQSELALLTDSERHTYEGAGPKFQRTLEQTLREKVKKRAAEKGIDLVDISNASQSAPALNSTDYGAARFIIGVEDFFGWITIVSGATWFVWSVVRLLQTAADPSNHPLGGLSLLSLIPAIGLVAGGVVVLGQGQMLRANLDTADSARQMLRVLMRLQG